MTVGELVEQLLKENEHDTVMIRDNVGPQDIGCARTYTVTQEDEDNCGDCEGLVGRRIVVITPF